MREYQKIIKLQQNLRDEYFDAFSSINVYIRNSGLDEYKRDELVNDILDMILQAQERGEDIKTVIGSDYKVFCDEIINESSKDKSFYFKFIKFMRNSFFMAAYYCTIRSFGALGLLLFNQTKNAYIEVNGIDVIFILTLIVIAYAIPKIFSKSAFNKHKIRKGILYSILLLAATFGIITLFTILTKGMVLDTLFYVQFYYPLIAAWLIYFITNHNYKKLCAN